MTNYNALNKSDWARKIGISGQLLDYWLENAEKGRLSITACHRLIKAGYQFDPKQACAQLKLAEEILSSIRKNGRTKK
jgi:transposase-like protein